MAIQTTTFKGARYLVKFHDPIEWSESESYEAIEAVQYGAFTYISKQPVPAGVQISNTDFWLLWADPNAQMEELRALVQEYKNDFDAFVKDTNWFVTVGELGDYQNINDAINDLTAYHKIANITAEIMLLSGFVMNEQVIAKGCDLSWITISSQDNIVYVNPTAISRVTIAIPAYYQTSWVSEINITAAFTAVDGGFLPIINTLFSYPTLRTGISGIAVGINSRAIIRKNCGFNNANNNLYVIENSYVQAMGADIKNANTSNLIVFRNSQVGIWGGNLTNNSTVNKCTYVDGASIVELNGSTISNGNTGVHCSAGTVVDLSRSNVRNCSNGVYIDNDGKCILHETNIVDCSTNGIYIRYDNTVNINTCNFTNCTYGVLAARCNNVNMTDCVFTNCNYSMEFQHQGIVNLKNCTLCVNAKFTDCFVTINNCNFSDASYANSRFIVNNGNIIITDHSTEVSRLITANNATVELANCNYKALIKIGSFNNCNIKIKDCEINTNAQNLPTDVFNSFLLIYNSIIYNATGFVLNLKNTAAQIVDSAIVKNSDKQTEESGDFRMQGICNVNMFDSKGLPNRNINEYTTTFGYCIKAASA